MPTVLQKKSVYHYNVNNCSSKTMPVNLYTLQNQITAAGAQIASRFQNHTNVLPAYLRQLQQTAQQPDLLDKVERAGSDWWGAKPSHEPIDAVIAAPPPPTAYTVLASDGSQIFPDKHEAHQYYLLNISVYGLYFGGNRPPLEKQKTILAVSDADLLLYQNIVSKELVNKRRSVMEVQFLAEQVLHEPATPPVIALCDGRLGVVQGDRISTAEQAEHDRLLQEHLRALDQIAHSGAALGGYVDRPGGKPVLDLLALSTLDINEIPTALKTVARPLNWFSDATLFAGLLRQPGSRSAVFELLAGWNKAYQSQPTLVNQTHSIFAFYLNISRTPTPIIARVECPQWVATNPALLTNLHAVVFAQAQYSTAETPYPLVLTLADSAAVVQAADREIIDDMLTRELLQHGILPQVSAKLHQKQIARPKRRF
jgi:hypothetical protein